MRTTGIVLFISGLAMDGLGAGLFAAGNGMNGEWVNTGSSGEYYNGTYYPGTPSGYYATDGNGLETAGLVCITVGGILWVTGLILWVAGSGTDPGPASATGSESVAAQMARTPYSHNLTVGRF
jgi:hypothetical protein